MREKLYKYMIMSAVLVAGLLPSCRDDMSDNSPKEPLEVSRARITVGRNAEDVYIGVTARREGWDVTGDTEWCLVDNKSGDVGTTMVTVSFLPNEEDDTRRTTLVFTSGSLQKEIPVEQLTTEIIPPNQHEESGTNKAIHLDILNEWYYWYEEAEETPADYNQNYKSFFQNYLSFFRDNELDGGVWSYDNERYLYSYIEKFDRSTVPAGTVALDYGMEFDIPVATYDGKMVARVLYVLKDSPADNAGLRRGNWFNRINDVQIGDWNYLRLLDTLRPVENKSVTLGLLRFQSSSGSLTDEGQSVSMTPARFRGSPILHSSVIDEYRSGTQPIPLPPTGYLVYNGFDPGFRDELIREFEFFRSREITDLVLDLRYSKSGTVEMAELLANLIAPESVRGATFARYEFSAKQGGLDRVPEVLFDPHPSGVGVNTLYILTSKHTAGPAELLINAFRGVDGVRLVMIGDTTEGMPVGMVKRTHRSDNLEYDVYPVSFICHNADGQAGYSHGINPNKTVDMWSGEGLKWSETFGWKAMPGATEDLLLRTALDYIRGYTDLPTGEILDATSSRTTTYPREYFVRTSMIIDIEE